MKSPSVQKIFVVVAFLILIIILAQGLRHTSYDVSIGTADDQLFTEGFYEPEQSPEHGRWTDAESNLRLFGLETSATALIRIRAGAFQSTENRPISTTLHFNQKSLHIKVPPQWRIYHVFASGDSARWKTWLLDITSAIQKPVENDQRELGILVNHVEIQTLTTQWYALSEYIIFSLLVIGLLTWLMVLITKKSWIWWLGIVPLIGMIAINWVRPRFLATYAPPLWNIAFMITIIVANITIYQSYQSQQILHRKRIWLGLSLAFLGGYVLRIGRHEGIWIGGGLLLLGAWVTVRYSSTQSLLNADETLTCADGLLLIGLVLLAGLIRFWRLDSVPFGLWRDEARHGLVALKILNDPEYRPIYVLNRVDLPALLFYLQTIPIRFFGTSIWALRSVSALAGSLTVLPLFFVGRELWDKRIGFLTAFLAVCSSWNIAMSHFASPAILDPLFTFTGIAGLPWLTRPTRIPSWFQTVTIGSITGLSFGLALYTYHTGRLAPIAAIWVLLLRLGFKRKVWQTMWTRMLVPVVIMGIVALPLFIYMLNSPEGFNRRIDEIGLLSDAGSPTVALIENVTRYVLMWNVEGDANARHYPGAFPMVDLFTGVFLVIGFFWLLRHWYISSVSIVLGLLGLWLLPGLLSSQAPHSLRAINVLGIGLLVAARGWSVFLNLWRIKATRLVSTILLGGAIMIFNLWVYFGHMPYDPQVWYEFDSATESAIGDYVRDSDPTIPIFIPQRIIKSEVYQFLTAQRDTPALSFAFETSTSFPSSAFVLVGTNLQPDEQAWVERTFPYQIAQPMTTYPGTQQPTFWLYQIQR